MLSKSMWLACLLWAVAKSQNQQQEMNCTVEDGEMPDSQFGRNNFVIDNLDSLLFPFAIGQCTSGHLYQTNTWFMYECIKDSNDMWTVMKIQHTDDLCSSTGMIVDQFLENNMTEGMKGYFECNGTNTYLRMEFSLNPECQNQVTVYGALGSCVNFVNSSTNPMQLNLFCDNDGARFQIFSFMLNQTMTTIEPFNGTLPSSISNQSQMCSADSFCDKWILSGACDLLTDLPFGNNQTQLYARWIGCLTVREVILTTDLMMSSTEATLLSTEIKSTAMSTADVIEEEDSSAVRPSFLFSSGLFFALSFLFSV